MIEDLLQSAKLKSPYLTVQEFAAYTKGTVRWTYSLTSQRLVPFIKAQGRILFHKDVVDEWLRSNNVAMLSEIQNSQIHLLQNLKSKTQESYGK